MKKLINRPEKAVEEMLEGLVAVYPGLTRLAGQQVLVRSDVERARAERVGLISGGGSGHEPAHAGYVGRGMLTAAVAGNVFASPSSDSVLSAIRTAAGPRGALLIIKNYTGDRLNFGLAAEAARAEGIPVETVIVADDVALAASSQNAGRRGLAGTVLVHKIAGAAAEAGLGLAEIAAEAKAAAQAVRTMGVALSPCTVPGADQPSFVLSDDEMELGLGIHGEAGVLRTRLGSAGSVVQDMLGRIVADGGWTSGQRLVLMVNNLGGTTTMELAIVAREAIAMLRSRGYGLERIYMGTFLSSLEMAGISLSVLPVDDARLGRLDAETDAPAWPRAASAHPRSGPSTIEPANAPMTRAVASSSTVPIDPPPWIGRVVDVLAAIAEALDASADALDDQDRAVGDGDIGSTLSRGARAALDAALAAPAFAPDPSGVARPSSYFREIALAMQRAMGGTSGPLYGVFLLRGAAALDAGHVNEASTWADALEAGCRGVAELGGAQPGDRTMLDALSPAAAAFRQAVESRKPMADALALAIDAAQDGARSTAGMIPKRGRSSYLGERALGHPDPGADAVVIWLGAIARAFAPGDDRARDLNT